MPRQIVISVGTSLLTNLMFIKDLNDFLPPPPVIDHTRLREKINDFLNLDCPNFEQIKYKEHIKDSLKKERPYGYLQEIYQTYVEQLSNSDMVKKHYNYRGTSTRDCLPAEISTLYHLYYTSKNLPENDDSDEITLLCTQSVESVSCAVIIKKIIEENNLFKQHCKFPSENGIRVVENLNMHKGAGKWIAQKNGVIDPECGLWKLRGIIEQLKNTNQPMTILRTGGYKEFSAHLLLVAIEFKIHSLALFENSVVAIETSPQDVTDCLIKNAFYRG